MFTGGAFVGLSVLFSLVPLVLIVVVFLVAGRGEPDPEGRRPYASYLCAVSFVAVFIALFALFGVATSIADVVQSNDDFISSSSGGFSSDSISSQITSSRGPTARVLESSSSDDEHWNAAVQAGLIAVAALALLVLHLRRLGAMTNEAGFFRSAAWRVHQVFLYLVCFVAVLTLLGAAVSTAYGGFRALAPGVTSTGSRSDGVSQLVTSGLLALAAGVIYQWAWTAAQRNRLASPEPFEPPVTA